MSRLDELWAKYAEVILPLDPKPWKILYGSSRFTYDDGAHHVKWHTENRGSVLIEWFPRPAYAQKECDYRV